MALIISTGTNLGNRLENLQIAKQKLCLNFSLIEESRVYESPAVDYLNQPDFLNQVLAFELPELEADDCIILLLEIEKEMGRERKIAKGPRIIDLDILFWGQSQIDSQNLTVPHPRLFQRSFIVEPLKELSYFKILSAHFNFPEKFDNSCWLFKS